MMRASVPAAGDQIPPDLTRAVSGLVSGRCRTGRSCILMQALLERR